MQSLGYAAASPNTLPKPAPSINRKTKRMSLNGQATTAAGAVVGTAGTTFPAWNDALNLLGGAWPTIIQFGGFLVILLTAVKLLLEIRKLLRSK